MEDSAIWGLPLFHSSTLPLFSSTLAFCVPTRYPDRDMGDEKVAESARPKPRALRTIRFAVREAWDALGLLCAASFTLFVAVFVPIFLGLNSLPLGIISACVISAPLFAGACYLAHKVSEHDEPTYGDLWRGFR